MGENVIELQLQEGLEETDFQKEFLEDEVISLSNIKENDIAIHTIYVYEEKNNIETKAYICNGFKGDIDLGVLPIALVDGEGNVILEKDFDLSNLGRINCGSAMPIKLIFEKTKENNIDIQKLKLAFKRNIKGEVYLNIEYEQLPKEIDETSRDILVNFLQELPKIKEGEFTISTFSIGFMENGQVLITLVFRNGNSEEISINKLPITLKDASFKRVKSVVFSLDNFTIKPYSAKILNLEMNIDLPLAFKEYLEGWNVEFCV